LPRDADFQDAALGHELRDPVMDRLRLGTSSAELLSREISEAKKHLVDAVGVTRRALADKMLERKLEIGHRVLVEKLAKLHLAQKRAELRGIDREGLRAQLRERRVAFVHEVRDVVEEKRRGERRRRACIDGVDAELARPDRREKPDEP